MSVTVSRSCVVCDGELEGRRRQTAYCSSACRQKAYRRRRATDAAAPFRLTAETREALKRAIDRRRRELLVAREATEADRALFADEAVSA